MKISLSNRSRYELVQHMAHRYQEVSHAQKIPLDAQRDGVLFSLLGSRFPLIVSQQASKDIKKGIDDLRRYSLIG